MTDCNLCFLPFEEPLRVPKNMGCGHVYCLACLKDEKAHWNGRLLCPKCREVRSKVVSFQRSFEIDYHQWQIPAVWGTLVAPLLGFRLFLPSPKTPTSLFLGGGEGV